jgi:hypothetical protein
MPVRVKDKRKKDEAEDTTNTKQSKSIPSDTPNTKQPMSSSSNPNQSPSEPNEEGLSGLDYDVTKELINLADEATKKITCINQIVYAIPSEPNEPIIAQMQIQGAGAYDIRRYLIMNKILSAEEIAFIYKSSQPDSCKKKYIKNEFGMSGTTCIFPNKYDLTSSKSILGNFYKFNKALNTFLKENEGKYVYTYERRSITKEAYKEWMKAYISKRGTSKSNEGIQRETSVSSTASSSNEVPTSESPRRFEFERSPSYMKDSQ